MATTSPRSAANDDAVRVLPIYLVVDVSGSMSGAAIDGVNRILPAMCAHMLNDPTAADCAHISLISFNQNAAESLPLTSLSQLIDDQQFPHLTASGGTAFRAPLELVRARIESDVDDLKGRAYVVMRPVVVFLTDGHNNGPDWRESFNALTGQGSGPKFAYYPQIVPFGFGDADEHALDALVYPKSATEAYQPRYYLAPSGDVTDIMNSMIAGLSMSVLASARAASNGGWLNPAPSPAALGANSPIEAKDASPFPEGAYL